MIVIHLIENGKMIFSQSNVNITIDTKIHPVTSLHISNQTNRLTAVMERIIKRI